ncbi:MAG: hypothetical protein IH840_16270 [Candidatus Heimdallarchaeota archaeon]|nr:hypothetical protein [Candidatus Heimdallarchaeota archaeon]
MNQWVRRIIFFLLVPWLLLSFVAGYASQAGYNQEAMIIDEFESSYTPSVDSIIQFPLSINKTGVYAVEIFRNEKNIGLSVLGEDYYFLNGSGFDLTDRVNFDHIQPKSQILRFASKYWSEITISTDKEKVATLSIDTEELDKLTNTQSIRVEVYETNPNRGDAFGSALFVPALFSIVFAGYKEVEQNTGKKVKYRMDGV